MNRRRALILLGSASGLVGASLWGRHAFLPPAPSDPLRDVDDLAREVVDAMSPDVRREACVPYDHPYRQYHNRGVGGGGIRVSSGSFSREERGMLTDLLFAGLSAEGRGRVPEQFFINWPGIHLMKLLVCGDPASPPYQVVLTGPHLNLRLGGRSREGAAFGGPQVYGDQRGNYKQGLPRNVYRYQHRAGCRLFASLDDAQRRAAVQARSPIQTQIEVQGRGGIFPGIAVSALSVESRGIVHELIDGILATYRPEDAAYAWQCLDANGGLDELHLSFYEEGEVDGSGEYQIFRLEGPAAVFYFRGFPHVHAFVNVAMDGERPLSVGEVVGANPAVLEGPRLRVFFEQALLEATGAHVALYPDESTVGRLRPGTVRTGDLYTAESWQDTVAVLEVRGSGMRKPLVERMRRLGGDPEPGRVYTVATNGYAAGEGASDLIGRAVSREQRGLVRDALIAHARKHGFPAG